MVMRVCSESEFCIVLTLSIIGLIICDAWARRLFDFLLTDFCEFKERMVLAHAATNTTLKYDILKNVNEVKEEIKCNIEESMRSVQLSVDDLKTNTDHHILEIKEYVCEVMQHLPSHEII